MKIKYRQLSDNLYEIPKNFDKDMKVPARFYASNQTLSIILNDNSLKQLINVAKLPNIINYSIAMPDIHQGYGFPIGGVAAFDYNNGIISPGGVGYDINCGVRLLRSNLHSNEIKDNIKNVTSMINSLCPTGTGKGSCINVSIKQLKEILKKGAKAVINGGYGEKRDLNFIEDYGAIDCDINKVSSRAQQRGKYQVGSLGGGNHFLEIGFIEKIYDEKKSDVLGLFPGQVVVQIHCGSRGLGHQVCTDYLKKFQKYTNKKNITLPDRQLVYAKINSKEGKSYFNAMNAAANFAFANRQVLTHFIRKAFNKSLSKLKKPKELDLIYDITHNIAKIENYKNKKIIIHRKGATRAFGPNHAKIPEEYKQIGQPILVPGSMGTYSYILSGTKKGEEETFGSSCHGAGRVMSRTKARKSFTRKSIINQLAKKNIYIQSKSTKGIIEEGPGAYKDVNEVVKILDNEKLINKIARIKPMSVIKG